MTRSATSPPVTLTTPLSEGAVQQLELERAQLLKQVNELRAANQRLTTEMKALQNKLCTPTQDDIDEAKKAMQRISSRSLPPGPDDKPPTLEAIVVVTISRLQRENSLLTDRNEMLQARVIQLMDEKVRLLNRIEEEEHLTTQLSQETETIGEYIALYQVRTLKALVEDSVSVLWLDWCSFRSIL